MKRNKPTIFGHQEAEIRNIPIFAHHFNNDFNNDARSLYRKNV